VAERGAGIWDLDEESPADALVLPEIPFAWLSAMFLGSSLSGSGCWQEDDGLCVCRKAFVFLAKRYVPGFICFWFGLLCLWGNAMFLGSCGCATLCS